MKIGWFFLVASMVLLVVGLPEGPQQGYVLFAMLVCLAAAILIIVALWAKDR